MSARCFFTGVKITKDPKAPQSPYTQTKEHLIAKNHPWYDPKNGPRNCVPCAKYVNSTLGHMPLFAKLEFKRRFTETTNIYPNYKEKVKATIRAWFSGGNKVEILNDCTDVQYRKALDSVAGLRKLVESELKLSGDELYTYMELVLHGLAEFNIVNKDLINSHFTFRDLLANMLNEEDMFGDLEE